MTAPPSSEPIRPAAERHVLLDGVFSRLMDSWTGGIFLAGLAILVGANNFQIGVLASLPFLAQVAQLPAVHLMVRLPSRRRIVVVASLLARSLLVLLAALMLLGELTPGRLIGVMAASAVFTVIATAAWNTWMREVLEPKRLGRFFASRLQITSIVGATALVAGGWFVDWWSGDGSSNDAYALLYWAGAAAGYVSVAILARTPTAAPPPFERNRERGAFLSILHIIRAPGSPRTVLALALVAIALGAALPFSAVYLLRSLDYSFRAVTLLILANQAAYILVLRTWGRFSDNFGNRPVMQVSAALLAIAMLGWGIEWSGPTALYVHLLAVHIATGIAVAGLDLTTSNLLLKTAPADNVAPHLAAFGITRAGIAGVTTLLAALAWNAMDRGVILKIPLWADAVWSLRGFHVLAFASALAAVLSLRALSRIPEPAVREMPELVRAIRKEVQSMSSVMGMRSFAHAASYIVEALRTPFAGDGPRGGRGGRRRLRPRGPG